MSTLVEAPPATSVPPPPPVPVIELPPRAKHFFRREWFVAYVAALLVAAAAFGAAALSGNDFLVPTGILMGAAAGELAVLAWAQARTRCLSAVRDNDLFVCGLFGGAIGVTIAGVLDQAFIMDDGSILLVGFFEEPAKLVVPLGMLIVGRYRSVEAALGLALASATGFAVLESIAYGIEAWTNGGGIDDAAGTLTVRSLTAPLGHLAWTSIAMLAFARARVSGRGVWWIRGAWGLGLAIVLHSLYDLGAFSGDVGLLALPVAAAISYVLFWRFSRGLWWSSLTPEGEPRLATVVRIPTPKEIRPAGSEQAAWGLAATGGGVVVPGLSAAGIVLGIVALVRSGRAGSEVGRGRAVVAIALGSVLTALWLLVLIAGVAG